MTVRVSYLIKRVERGLRIRLDAALEPLGVTTTEYTALSVLARRSGLSSAQLARRSFVSDQAMNQIVVGLERNGWIERSPDPHHARILRAKMTRAGRAILAACDRVTAPIERQLLEGLASEETERLRKMLEICAASLSPRAEARESAAPTRSNP
jgi:DNA-binding MarR family transcriptional regulator